MSNRRLSLLVLSLVAIVTACMPRQTVTPKAGHATYRDRLTAPDRIRADFGILDIECYVWIDRMPSARRSTSEGLPLHVALKLTLDSARTHPDRLQLHSISLWHTAGDSVLATMPLTTLDGDPAWIGIGSDWSVEFTSDRTVRVFMNAEYADSLAPHLLITGPGENEVIRLPDLVIESVY